MSILVDYIRAIRENLDLPQDEFALKIGIEGTQKSRRSRVSKIENGNYPPTLEELINISRLEGLSIHWLLTGEGEKYISASLEPAEKDGEGSSEISDSIKRLLYALKKSKDPSRAKNILQVFEYLANLPDEKMEIALNVAKAFMGKKPDDK